MVCPVNSHGSSGAMESEVTFLKLTHSVFRESDGRVFVKHIVSDDDSSMRDHLQNHSSCKKVNLDEEVQEPNFFADPSHRINVMSAPIFKMVTKTRDLYKCKQVNTLYI